MADERPMTLESVRTKALGFRPRDRIKCRWADDDNIGNIREWHGVITEVEETFAVARWDEHGDGYFQIPYEGVIYYELDLENARRYQSWREAAKETTHAFGIIPWRPRTWEYCITLPDRIGGHANLMRELDDFFFTKPYSSLPANAPALQYERASWREVLSDWVLLAQSSRDWHQQPMLQMAQRVVVRLSGLRRAEYVTDSKERAKIIQETREAFRVAAQDAKHDKLNEIMERPLQSARSNQ
jgi:hypothetical protein